MAMTQPSVQPISQPGDSSVATDLTVRNLYKSFQTNGQWQTILDGIDLTVKAGEFLVLLGPSGCGKSTLLRIIAGLEAADVHPDTQLLLGGRPISGPGPERGFVFQSYSSFPWLTAKGNVEFGLRAIICDRRERERRALHYLELVGLSDRVDYYPRDLSGGQQQRVAIARTLATSPQLLLMDEPYAALDAQNREAQQTELLRIWREARPTILFVTHDISEAVYLGRRIIVLGQRPAIIVADLETEHELEARIDLRVHGAAQHARVEVVPRTVPLEVPREQLTIENRAGWIREQPEFYELLARLKHMLPRPNDG